MRLEVDLVVLCRVFVLTLVLLHLRHAEIDDRVLLLVFAAQRTLVTVRRTGVVQYPIALALPESDITLQVAVFLRTQATVALLIDIAGRVVLADSELLIRPLDTLLHRASAQSKEQ